MKIQKFLKTECCHFVCWEANQWLELSKDVFGLIISSSGRETMEYGRSMYTLMVYTELIWWLSCLFYSCLSAFCYLAEAMQAALVHECRRSSQGLSHSAHATGRWDTLWSWDGRFPRRVSHELRDYPRKWLLCVLALFMICQLLLCQWINVAMFVWCRT